MMKKTSHPSQVGGPGCSRAELEMAKEAEVVGLAMVAVMEMVAVAVATAGSEVHLLAGLEVEAAQVKVATALGVAAVVAEEARARVVVRAVMVAMGCSA